jgi:hypothetical protein
MGKILQNEINKLINRKKVYLLEVQAVVQDLQTLGDTRSGLLNREAGLLLLNFRAACCVGCCFSVASLRTKKQKYHCCGS